MEGLVKFGGMFVLALGLVFMVVMLGSLFGAAAGLVVGIVFDDTMRLMAHMLGVPTAAPWQLGCMLGFIGGFFRGMIEKPARK